MFQLLGALWWEPGTKCKYTVVTIGHLAYTIPFNVFLIIILAGGYSHLHLND